MRLIRQWLPVVLWAAIILSAANDRFSDAQTGGWLERLFGRVPPEVNVLMRKTAHVAEYAVLALLAWRARRTFMTPMLITLVVSSADETLQGMTVTRTGTPKDVALDLLGAAIALTCAFAIRARLASRPRAE